MNPSKENKKLIEEGRALAETAQASIDKLLEHLEQAIPKIDYKSHSDYPEELVEAAQEYHGLAEEAVLDMLNCLNP